MFRLDCTDPAENAQKSDFLAFLMIVFLAARLRARGIKIQNLVETMAVDAGWYFLVIFTSHLVLAMTLYFGRVSATVSLSRDGDQWVLLQESIKLLPAV